jgi:hypothetical protein
MEPLDQTQIIHVFRTRKDERNAINTFLIKYQ